MWKDPIVEEVRRVRDEHAARLGYDLEAIFRDVQEAQERGERAGWKVVRLNPAAPKLRSSAKYHDPDYAGEGR